jgi:hypothetical protein
VAEGCWQQGAGVPGVPGAAQMPGTGGPVAVLMPVVGEPWAGSRGAMGGDRDASGRGAMGGI